jgi:hypothetical protein
MKIKNYTIIFAGALTAEQVSIQERQTTRLIDVDLQTRAEKHWQNMLAEASVQGKKIWDSQVYRFESGTIKDNQLHLQLSTIPFSIRVALNKETKRLGELGEFFFPLGMYTSIILHTADGQYVFIEKSDKYFTNKRFAFVGGVLSKSEKVLTSGQDLFDEVSKELKEELGLSDIHIDSVLLRAGYRTENYNFCLLFEVTLTETLVEVQSLFAAGNDGEAKRVIGIEPKELGSFVQLLEDKDKIKFEILDMDFN